MSSTAPTSDPAQLAAARALVARVAGYLFDRRLTELQGGNMSARVGDAVVVTPTLASERNGWRLIAEDTVVHALDGSVIGGDPARISRENRLHLRLYRAYPELGSVFHLHHVEVLAAAASGRWAPGVVHATADPYGAPLVLLEPGLDAQTEPHDGRVEQLLGLVPRADGAISVSPTHGIISVARDVPTNVRAAELLCRRLEHELVRGRLRAAARAGIA